MMGLLLAAALACGQGRVAVMGGSFSSMPASQVAKAAWTKELGCVVDNYGAGGMGFVAGVEVTNAIPDQIGKALRSGRRYDALILWASTNDIWKHTVEEQNAAIERSVEFVRKEAPGTKVLLFTSMPVPLSDANGRIGDFVEGQRKTCDRLGVPCLDLYTASGITLENAAELSAADRFHPNEAGYAKIMDLQVAFLREQLYGPVRKTRIVLYADTEDYTCDRANDGIRDFANALTEEGVRGCFNITGYLALRIQEFGRQDVIRALKPHCLGTQTLYHSRHPTPAEIADDPNYERAYRRALMDESKATAMVEAVFGEGRSVFTCPPGKSISTPAMEAWYDLGYTFAAGNGYTHCGDWGAQVARPGWEVDGLWYCNLYQPPYTFLFELEQLVTREDLLPEYFKKVLDTLAQYDFAGVGFHPSMQLWKAHWDTVNYKGGNNVPWRKWNVPPAMDPEDTAGFYRNLRAFLRAVKADGRFSFTDFDEMKKGVRPRVVMRPEHLKAVRASLEADFNCIRTPASWSVADCFYAVVGFLRGEKAYRPTKVYGFLERPVGVREPVEVSRKGLAEAAAKIDLSTFLPPSIEVDGRKIGPADFLFAALEALTEDKETVRVVPREQLGSFKEVPDLEKQCLANTWVIFDKDFKDKYVSERFRLQLWTLRIDPVVYPCK